MTAKNAIPVVLITTGPALKYALPVVPVTLPKGGVPMTKAANGRGIPIREVTKFGIPIIYTT